MTMRATMRLAVGSTIGSIVGAPVGIALLIMIAACSVATRRGAVIAALENPELAAQARVACDNGNPSGCLFAA